ncbi:14213_t:CDS:1, partial [Gigaspora margarita]
MKSLEDFKILKKDRELMFPITLNICQERINRHKQAYGLALTCGTFSNNIKTENTSQLTSLQVDNDHFLKIGCHNINGLK